MRMGGMSSWAGTQQQSARRRDLQEASPEDRRCRHRLLALHEPCEELGRFGWRSAHVAGGGYGCPVQLHFEATVTNRALCKPYPNDSTGEGY